MEDMTFGGGFCRTRERNAGQISRHSEFAWQWNELMTNTHLQISRPICACLDGLRLFFLYLRKLCAILRKSYRANMT